MNNQYLFKIIIYNNCNETVKTIDFNNITSSSILPEPFNNVKLYINPQLSDLTNIKEKFILSNDNKYILGLEKYTINNKLYYKSNDNKSLFFSFVEYLMNNITYESKTYIFNNTTELKYPVYKIEIISNIEKVTLIHSADNSYLNNSNNENNELNSFEKKIDKSIITINCPIKRSNNNFKVNYEKDYIFTLTYETKENVNFKTIIILNKYNFIDIVNEKPVLTDIYEPIGTRIIQTILNQSLINSSFSELSKSLDLQEEIYKKSMLIQEQKIKQLEEDTKNIKSINDLHKELISNINTTMSMISKKYEKTYKDCEDSIKQQQEIFQEKVNCIENECTIVNPEQITKEELTVKYNNLLKVLINKNSKISSQEQDIKRLQENLNKYSKENLLLKSEKDKLNEKMKSSPRTPRFNVLSLPMSPKIDNKNLDNKMDELIKSIHDISNNNDKDNIIKNQQEQINKLNETLKEKDDRIKSLINSCESAYKLVKNNSIENLGNSDIIENYKELLKEYINFIKNILILLDIKDKNIFIKLNELTSKIIKVIDANSLQDIKIDILYIEDIISKYCNDKIIINKDIIEKLINGIINVYDFIKEIIGYVAKLNTGKQINESVLSKLFNSYDENCKNINLIIKPLIQNYLPNMRELLVCDSDTEYNIEDYDDSDREYNSDSEYNDEETYNEDLESNSDSESDTDNESESDYENDSDESKLNDRMNKLSFNNQVNQVNQVNSKKKELNQKVFQNKNIIVSSNSFKPKNGYVHIKPIQIKEKMNENERMNEKERINEKIQQNKNSKNQVKRKNKIKTANTQAIQLFNMLVKSYNKQNIRK